MAKAWDEYEDDLDALLSDYEDELDERDDWINSNAAYQMYLNKHEASIDEIVEILEQQERDSYNAAVKDSLSQLDGTEETAVEYVLRVRQEIAKEIADYANELEDY